MTNGRIFGKCGDCVGSFLQWKKWKKWESRDRFKKLEVSDFKKIVVHLYDVEFILSLFLPCLSQLAKSNILAIIPNGLQNRLNKPNN